MLRQETDVLDTWFSSALWPFSALPRALSCQLVLLLWHGRHGAGSVLMQETDVLDTWFSSALWPFSTCPGP